MKSGVYFAFAASPSGTSLIPSIQELLITTVCGTGQCIHPTLPSSQKQVLETWYGGQLSVILALGKMRQGDCHKFEAGFDSTVSSKVA